MPWNRGPLLTSSELLRSLLAVELSCRRREGEVLNLDEYRTRFPDHTHLIDSLFRGLIRHGGTEMSRTVALSLNAISERDLVLLGYAILGETGPWRDGNRLRGL